MNMNECIRITFEKEPHFENRVLSIIGNRADLFS